MKNFFKIFFASLLAIIVFSIVVFFIFLGIIFTSMRTDKPIVLQGSVLVLDLSNAYPDFAQASADFSFNFKKLSVQPLNLYDVIRLIAYARNDANIKGLYIKAENNANGLASSEELRQAVQDFETGGKFVIAYGATISQNAYFVASAANKVYTHPQGGLEWRGMVVQTLFFKNLMDKLGIQPEIFYAGKFKSATEPFRVTQMTDPNRLQTSVWLNDIYANYLAKIAQSREIDMAQLRTFAAGGYIQTANDALKYHLVDSLLYSDEVLRLLHQYLYTSDKKNISFVSMNTYAQAVDYKNDSGKDDIAVLYAQGDIVSGKSNKNISSDNFIPLLRSLRNDDDIKAIVIRVNSPGGSALVSDMIWREISLAKKEKPVIISMGDYAASGGYYMSCGGSFIFAEPNTITGSIGVFSLMGNAQNFFNNKLGITFDQVKTSPYADLGTLSRPMTQPEKNMMQAGVDSIYQTFLTRVSEGRKQSVADIDSIAQGRVWTGVKALQIGLVDSIGSLSNAISYAAKLAHSNSYSIKEYPRKKSVFDQWFNNDDNNETAKSEMLTKQFGTEIAQTWRQILTVKAMLNTPQTRLPFEMEVK